MKTQKNRKNLCRRFCYIISLCLIVSFCSIIELSIVNNDLSAKENKVIRVGFPIQMGLSEIDENGNYRGYTYEYLMELAQYTGWEYEFVTPEGSIDESLSTLLSMLEKGEIDLLGGMNYNEELAQRYSYPGYSYGNSYTCLGILKNNKKINELNYYIQNG